MMLENEKELFKKLEEQELKDSSELQKGGYPAEKQPTEKQIDDNKKFEEILSPLIRYGYNSALVDIEQYLVSIMEQHDIDTLTVVQNKIHEMMESKKLVDKEKLLIEVLKSGG